MTMMALKYNGTPQFLFQGEGAGEAASSGAAPTASGSPTSGTPPSSQTSASETTDISTSPTDGGMEAFEAIFGGGEEGLDVAAPAKTEVPPELPQATTPPAQQVAPQPAPQQVQPQPPAQAQAPQPPVQQPQGQVPGGAIPPELDRFNPAQLASALTANRDQVVEALASHVFALTPQETEALETNVVEAIPKLMAKVLLQAQVSTLTQMANILPVMMQRHQAVSRGAEENEGAFWKAWPQLNRATHGQMVWSYATMFRQMYPKATLEDIITHVGHMVAGVVGARGGGNGVVSAPGGPAQAPVSRTNGRSPPQSPFVPAGGRGPANPSSGPELDPWSAVMGHQG